eukprot:7382379-Prymnesium_polylepis.1
MEVNVVLPLSIALVERHDGRGVVVGVLGLALRVLRAPKHSDEASNDRLVHLQLAFLESDVSILE